MLSRANSSSSPDTVLRLVLAAVALGAWCALWLWGRSSFGHMMLHRTAHVPMAASSAATFALLFVAGWTLMTLAMMLPSSLPLVLMFHRLVGQRPSASWLVTLLIAAYLSVWAACGILLLLLNSLLRGVVASLPWLAARPAIASAMILAIAGLYQFSSLKYACLDKCRSPMSFLITHWQGGNKSLQALRIGAEHGLYCVGCCWSLMLLMFLVSAGSLVWMLLLGVVMAAEKNLSWGRRLSAPLGAICLLGATLLLISEVTV